MSQHPLRTVACLGALLFLLLGGMGACAPAATATPSPTPTSPPTPTTTPLPSPDPTEIAATIAAGDAWLESAGVEPLCLRREDTDGDGQLEWLGLYVTAEAPGQLAGFVLDGDAYHELKPQDACEYGLGEYAVCELERRDVNNDGRQEILVWGHAEMATELLHLYQWDGTTYWLLGFFRGDAGVRLEDGDGDLIDEVVETYGVEGWDGLAWEAVYTWDGANYGWTWERYAWFYLDRPHAYRSDRPQYAVISFYLALDDRDLPGAYRLLSRATYPWVDYVSWAAGYDTMVAVDAGAVLEISRGADSALVAAQVRQVDNVDGLVVAVLWDVECTVLRTSQGWLLAQVDASELGEWRLDYYE
jgi:hypothetical protein